MSVYIKARELAGEILASEESCRLADAMAMAKDGLISDSEMNAAVNDFNSLVNEALEIVRMSIGIFKSCGNCGSCGKGE